MSLEAKAIQNALAAARKACQTAGQEPQVRNVKVVADNDASDAITLDPIGEEFVVSEQTGILFDRHSAALLKAQGSRDPHSRDGDFDYTNPTVTTEKHLTDVQEATAAVEQAVLGISVASQEDQRRKAAAAQKRKDKEGKRRQRLEDLSPEDRATYEECQRKANAFKEKQRILLMTPAERAEYNAQKAAADKKKQQRRNVRLGELKVDRIKEAGARAGKVAKEASKLRTVLRKFCAAHLKTCQAAEAVAAQAQSVRNAARDVPMLGTFSMPTDAKGIVLKVLPATEGSRMVEELEYMTESSTLRTDMQENSTQVADCRYEAPAHVEDAIGRVSEATAAFKAKDWDRLDMIMTASGERPHGEAGPAEVTVAEAAAAAVQAATTAALFGSDSDSGDDQGPFVVSDSDSNSA